MKRATAFSLAVALLLSACHPPPPPSANSTLAQAHWAERQQRLGAIHGFSLQGRIASSGPFSGSGEMDWHQTDDRFEVLLSGTFGVGAIRIEGSDTDIAIFTRDGEYQAQQAEDALSAKLGAPLPLADLRFWMLGLPRPGIPAGVELDDQDRLGSLDQEGWHLDYVDYREAAPGGPELPHKLNLSRNGNKWRVVIDRWSDLS